MDNPQILNLDSATFSKLSYSTTLCMFIQKEVSLCSVELIPRKDMHRFAAPTHCRATDVLVPQAIHLLHPLSCFASLSDPVDME